MYPNLFHFGHLQVPTFAVLLALGVVAALWLGLRCGPLAGVTADTVWDATVFVVVAAFLLSRLILVVTNWRSFLAYPLLLLRVPSLTGLGLLLTGVAAVVYLRVRGVPVLAMLDAWAAPGALLWAFLALGHMAEGSDPGLPSRAAWAVRVGADPDLQQPVALFAAVLAVALTAVLYARLRREHRAGAIAGMGLLLAGVVQFLLTFVRQPYPYAPDAPNFVLDPIEFLALGMVVAGGLLYGVAHLRDAHAARLAEPLAMPAGEVR